MSDVLRFDLAKDPKGNPITYGRVGDSDGLTRRVKVFEDGKPLDLTGWATTFEGNTSNWKTKVFDTEGINIIDATKGEFSYTFPNMAFAVEGQYERAYFSFMKGDQRKSTGNFEIIVLGDSDIDAPEAETIITEYNKLVAELNELQKNNIADLQEQQDTYIQSADNTFAAIQGRITNLQNTIKGFETSVNDTATDVLSTVNQALEELKAGDFYTQLEADARFAKTEDMSAHTENISNPHSVTKAQVSLGNVDNYSTATQVEAEAGTATNKFMTPLRTKQHVDKRIATKAEAEAGTSETAIMSPLRTKEVVDTNQPFGVSISGGLMEGVNRVDATTLTIGTIISYDNTHSKTNDLFNISSDQKTMTILRDCTLYFTGMFVSQTPSGSYYSVMRQFINGVNDLRLCGISGTVNWRNDCGFSVTRSFLQGDKITFVLGTNYTNASAEAFGISQLHIQEVLPV